MIYAGDAIFMIYIYAGDADALFMNETMNGRGSIIHFIIFKTRNEIRCVLLVRVYAFTRSSSTSWLR